MSDKRKLNQFLKKWVLMQLLLLKRFKNIMHQKYQNIPFNQLIHPGNAGFHIRPEANNEIEFTPLKEV